MSYCTLQDLIDEGWEVELIQLTDKAGTGQIDATEVQRAIDRADRTIHRYLGGAKTLPLDADDTVDLACDLARYYLYDLNPPEHIRTRYLDAVAQLKAMSKGELAVVDSAGQAAESSNNVVMTSSGRTFGRSDSQGFI